MSSIASLSLTSSTADDGRNSIAIAAGKQFLKLFVKPAAVVSGKKFLELSVKPAAACSEHASIKLLQEELANQKTKLAAKKAWALTELVTSLVTGPAAESLQLPPNLKIDPKLPPATYCPLYSA